MADTQEQPNFSGGRLVDRPGTAPANSIYYAHDTGERYRFLHGNWHLIDNVQQAQHEAMEHPGQDVLDAALAAREAATAPAASSGDSGDAGQAPLPAAKSAAKKSAK